MIDTVQQVELSQGVRRTVVWIDAGLRLRAGTTITGKDGQRWRVERVYAARLSPHLLNRGWSVGGLL